MKLRAFAKSLTEALGLPGYWLHQCTWEIRMSLVRMQFFSPLFWRKVRRIEQKADCKLLFGCGETAHLGWVGIDGIRRAGVGLTLDLRRKLPFSSNRASLCYSEHFLEHLTPREASTHLKEVFRVLKPGGRYRIVVPDARKFMEKFIEGDDAFFDLAFPWARTKLEAVYHIVNWNGAHRSLYDYEELTRVGLDSGFVRILLSGPNLSEISELNIDISDPQRVAESLYVELVK